MPTFAIPDPPACCTPSTCPAHCGHPEQRTGEACPDCGDGGPARHPLGPGSVTAFLIDDREGPFPLASMLEENPEEEDEELRAKLRAMAPGEVYYCPIGGGWTKIAAVAAC